MKNRILFGVLLLVCAFTSCKRRPLVEADHTVIVNIEIEKDIVNYKVPADPSLMRCIFYDSETGAFVTQAFLPPTGGKVSVIPDRHYHVLVYNFDTESTWLERDTKFDEIYASTSLIPDAFRTKLRSRASEDKVEEIVYDPDHLFVGRLKDVYIPARSVEAAPVVLNVYAETVVESWLLDVRTITGREYIGSIAAVITGLTEYNLIGDNIRSTDFVSVYFDNPVVDADGILTAKFNTFGHNPLCSEKQELSIVITDIAGNGHIFKADVSNQFPNNKEQIIRIVTKIDIPKPEVSSGGGFVPKVDEWDNINTEIII